MIIEISESNHNGYYFYIDSGSNKKKVDFYHSLGREYCKNCHAPLNKLYGYIINNLKQAGLLPNDHLILCCGCNNRLQDLGGTWDRKEFMSW